MSASSSWREPTPAKAPMTEYRCRHCRRVLFDADAEGRLVVVCKRCRASQEVKLSPSKPR